VCRYVKVVAVVNIIVYMGRKNEFNRVSVEPLYEGTPKSNTTLYNSHHYGVKMILH